MTVCYLRMEIPASQAVQTTLVMWGGRSSTILAQWWLLNTAVCVKLLYRESYTKQSRALEMNGNCVLNLKMYNNIFCICYKRITVKIASVLQRPTWRRVQVIWGTFTTANSYWIYFPLTTTTFKGFIQEIKHPFITQYDCWSPCFRNVAFMIFFGICMMQL